MPRRQLFSGEAEVVAVELPLSAPLYSSDSKTTEYQLVGIIDLLLRDAQGNLIVVDPQDCQPAEKPSGGGRGSPVDGLQLSTHGRRQGACPFEHPLPHGCPAQAQDAQVRALRHHADGQRQKTLRQDSRGSLDWRRCPGSLCPHGPGFVPTVLTHQACEAW